MSVQLALLTLSIASAAVIPADPSPPRPTRRFALLIGSDRGAPDRALLRYARSDAMAVKRVLTTLGGIASADLVLLADPSPVQVRLAFDQLRGQLREAARARARTELVFYYSGHSDEHSLLLGGEQLSYAELHALLASLATDFQIAVLDSCASGAFTRLKGGTLLPPLIVDQSTRTQGRAILTSSSAGEASQESDSVGGSFFTHHLLSALRGAADLSRDGRVTLNEAYQFAFRETLARTERTQAGAQHPAYDIEMAGSGDVVMTDLRALGSALALPPTLEGHLFVRDEHGNLVVELEKLPLVPLELGLEEGKYTLTLTRPGALSQANVTLAKGGRVVAGPEQFTPLSAELTASRGGAPSGPDITRGRWTVSLLCGVSAASSSLDVSPQLNVRARWKYFAVGIDTSFVPPRYSVGRIGAVGVGEGLYRFGPVEVSGGAGVGAAANFDPTDRNPAIAFQLHVGFAIALTQFLDLAGQFQVYLTEQDIEGPSPWATLGLGVRFRM